MASFQQLLGRTRLKGLSPVPPPCPLLAVPTSEDVDRELSRPRLFLPGGLLLVLKESLLPAKGRDMGDAMGPVQATGQEFLTPDWTGGPHLEEAAHSALGQGH